MKTPDSRPRFQAATRHYHRHHGGQRDWNDWIDPVRKSGRARFGWRLAGVLVFAAAAVGLLFAFGLL